MTQRQASGRKIHARFRLIRVMAILVLGLLAAFAVSVTGNIGEAEARRAITQKANETLAVQTETLTGILDKYRLLPPLLARQDDIASLFQQDLSPALAGAARRKAEEIAGLSGARDVVFLYPDGRRLASARGVFPGSREQRTALIETARQGRLGRAALSLKSAERAYAFASGVRRAGEMIGVIIVYVGFDAIEAAWSLSANPIFVSDPSGTVFLTNRADWRLQKVGAIIRNEGGGARYRSNEQDVPHLDFARTLPLLDWQLHVLADRRPVTEAWLFGAALAGLLSALVAAGVGTLLYRWELAILRQRRDRATALRLERIVRDRTKALSVTNQSRSREIDERREAETRLRRAQADLVQTGKLAALGQMSAALSHEFNQPLAAIRTYAENAVRLLAKGRTDSATDNLTRISAMVERMAELSRSLLSFSRRPGKAAGLVPLGAVLDEALILVRPRARKAGVALELDQALRQPSVRGGRIRLSQVFVNLVNNAIDALDGHNGGTVSITLASAKAGELTVLVADNGPGVPEELRRTVFEPFFTTKQSGDGIGIGLSIAYSIVSDSGGRIELRAPSDGGAAFAVTLRTDDAAPDTPE